MQFTLAILAVLSTSAIASPATLTSRNVITTAEAAEAMDFAIAAADCNIGDCVNIVASAVCIAGGILVRSVPVVTGCVQGGAPSVRNHHSLDHNLVTGFTDIITSSVAAPAVLVALETSWKIMIFARSSCCIVDTWQMTGLGEMDAVLGIV